MKNRSYLFGRNPIREKLKTLKSGELLIKKNVNNSTIIDIIKKAKSKNITITYIDNADFQRQFGKENTQGLVLKINEEYTNYITLEDLLQSIKENTKSILIILDGIEDVGNFGAILRNALLFNADGIIIPKNNSAPITETVAKRSAGALMHSKIVYVTNIVNTIKTLKQNDYWIYAADKSGKSLNEISFSKKSALIFGSENRGIRPLVKQNSDVIVTIPTNDKLDSLNLAVSTGIILYEINRNRD